MDTPTFNPSCGRFGGRSRLFVGIIGALGIAGLVAALVWVLQAQVQRSEALRAQWQSAPAGAPARLAIRQKPMLPPAGFEPEENHPVLLRQSAVLATSFSRQ